MTYKLTTPKNNLLELRQRPDATIYRFYQRLSLFATLFSSCAKSTRGAACLELGLDRGSGSGEGRGTRAPLHGIQGCLLTVSESRQATPQIARVGFRTSYDVSLRYSLR